RTVWPSAIRADATAPPIKPLAPVTKICILALPRFGRDENVAANSSPLHVAKPNTETTRRVLRLKSPTASPTAPNRIRRSTIGYTDSRVIDDRARALQAQLRSAHRSRSWRRSGNPHRPSGVPPNSLAESSLCPPYKPL